MNIHKVHEGIKKFKRRKRLGRGTGSGLGKTAGRGHKGQHSRSGASQHPAFQGGAMPMFRRIPKRGFNNPFALQVRAINVGQLESCFESGEEVTPESLKCKSIGKGNYDVVKILGDGELTKKLKVSAHRFSQSAREKIEGAGGEVIELPGKKKLVRNKMKSATG